MNTGNTGRTARCPGRHRIRTVIWTAYLVIGALFDLPGNALIGGGGGLPVSVAITPGPLFFLARNAWQ